MHHNTVRNQKDESINKTQNEDKVLNQDNIIKFQTEDSNLKRYNLDIDSDNRKLKDMNMLSDHIDDTVLS